MVFVAILAACSAYSLFIRVAHIRVFYEIKMVLEALFEVGRVRVLSSVDRQPV